MKLSIRTSVDHFTGASHSMIPSLMNKSREIGILIFLDAYFIALREDMQHLSMGDF
nr:hypothetical protein [Tanacetum cinerariifolium]